MAGRVLLLALACGFVSGTRVHGTAQSSVRPQAPQARATSTPYSGDLSIFETEGRDKRLQIDRVMTLLGIGPGRNVADIGAGSGWFTVRAAQRVRPGGAVYAEDINPQAASYIEKRARSGHFDNVRVVLGTPEDPKLPASSIDAVLMLKVYHEIASPVTLLRALRPSLRSGARLGVIDRNGDGADHGIMPEVVIREAEQAGFRMAGKYDFTRADGQDYFLIFEAR